MYDAIIVGARYARSPTAMLLARRGNQNAINAFLSAITGAIPLPGFMSKENISRIMAAANPA
jgi:hypothetical protein